MGEGVGRWPMEGGQGGYGGGGMREQCGSNKKCTGSWEAWGGGPWRAGKGGDGGGGAPESSVGATKGALVPPFRLPSKPNNWSDLAGVEGVHGGRARGEMGWGHQRALWEQQKVHLITGDKGGGMGGGVGRWPLEGGTTGNEGGGMGGGVGRWPMEGGQGGRWGGEQCGSNKICSGSLKT